MKNAKQCTGIAWRKEKMRVFISEPTIILISSKGKKAMKWRLGVLRKLRKLLEDDPGGEAAANFIRRCHTLTTLEQDEHFRKAEHDVYIAPYEGKK